MAGYPQLLLLIKRGTALESFNRLREQFANLKGYVSTYADVFNNKEAHQEFMILVEAADNFDFADIQHRVTNNIWERTTVEAHLPLDPTISTPEKSSITVRLGIDPFESLLLFPNFKEFTLFNLSLHSGDVFNRKYKPFVPDLLKIIDCFQPHFGFNELDISVYPRVVQLVQEIEEKKTWLPNFRANPLRFYQPTLVYGNNIITQIGRERLLSSPASEIYTTPNCVILCSPNGLFNFDNPLPNSNWKEEEAHLNQYKIAISQHLGLNPELS
jgi:hypothetical protein